LSRPGQTPWPAPGAAGRAGLLALALLAGLWPGLGVAQTGAVVPEREARALIAGLYESRAFEPLWADAARVVALRRAIDASAAHGLDPRDYHAQALAAALPPADARALQPSWNLARTLSGADPATAFARLVTAPDPATLRLRLAEVWRSRVIVGRAYRRTPEFRSTMEYLVLVPEWGGAADHPAQRRAATRAARPRPPRG